MTVFVNTGSWFKLCRRGRRAQTVWWSHNNRTFSPRKNKL